MSETIDELGPVEWLRDLFEDASAESMYRWMLLAWVAAVAVLILLDRIGWGLLGRSRPRIQTPPRLARLWRWRRGDVPAKYSLLPGKTVVFEGTSPAVPESLPFARSTPIEEAELVEPDETDPGGPAVLPSPPMLTAGPMSNDRFWRSMANGDQPVFGLENHVRLEVGRPPERYNPITDRIETLERDPDTGIASWPRPHGSEWRCVGIGHDPPDEGSGVDP